MEPTETRQLAAIMFADMVGYTALMQADEERAKELRDRHRAVLTELVSEFEGQILQYYGDGTLSIFTSAVEAVRCAVAVQAFLREDSQVPVRIGVHTGDVVYDGDAVYGHGVNVASRIEALAASGGIMVSGKVFDEIKNHPTLPAVPFGPVRLKNVDDPVEVFAVAAEGLAVPTSEEFRATVGEADGAASARDDEGPWPSSDGDGGEEKGPGEVFMQRVRDRAIIPWALVYLAGALAVMLAVGFVGDQLLWPALVFRGLGVLAFVGFFIVLVVAWHHGEKGRQPVNATEVVLITFILGLGVGSLALVHDRAREEAAGLLPAGALDSDETRPSIAVLPFDDFSPDPDDAYFANGVHEDITTALSRIRSLRVPARSSVERFRTDRPGTEEMAAALGADYLLEGSTTVVQGSVRVTVQLIDGRTDEHIWAEEYDHEFTVEDLIAVRSAVAQEVASHLRATITPEEEARIAALPTETPEAWELYQRARYRWNERTEAGVQASLRLFQRAIDLDSLFAEAYAGLADAYLVLSNWGWMDHRDGHRRGIAAAQRALELDPLNPGANASLGALHLWSTREWDLAEEHFHQAILLDPEHAYAHYWYSALLSALGRHGESVQEASDAKAVDPLSPQIAYGLSRSLFLAREYAEAEVETSAALERYPDYGPLHAQLCRIRAVQGQFQEAEEACAREQEVSGLGRTLSMALVKAFQGDQDGAVREMEGFSALQGGEELQPVIVAMILAGLGDTDAALERLDRAFDGDYPYLEYLPSNPFFDPLRGDPRFGEYLARLGL
ncbi:MAG: tetratricopeptide repeat protein [Gemmatimonadetes bacterium]|nr:tetratricopeptide repeat protein [Gemmatimonadota bacterium]